MECAAKRFAIGATAGDLDNGADHSTDLMLEKCIGSEPKSAADSAVDALCVDFGSSEDALGGATLIGGGEGGEVVQALEHIEGATGGFDGKWRWDAPSAPFVKRAALRGDQEFVAVFAFAGLPARVEIAADRLNCLDSNGGRKEVVESVQPATGGHATLAAKGGNLSISVDAGVGASSERDAERFLG